MISSTITKISLVAFIGCHVEGFAPSTSHRNLFGVEAQHGYGTLKSTIVDNVHTEQPEPPTTASQVVRTPLKYLGPYPAMGLRFPDLSTKSQRERNSTGISLDFILDTAANINTLNGQVASELELDTVGEALPGVSASGALAGGAPTFMLGDAQLENEIFAGEDNEEKEPFTFMTNLTASALPIASPASAGLLSLAFLQCFEGGVEFNWGQIDPVEKRVLEYPSIAFHGDESTLPKVGAHVATITPVPVTLLPTVMIKVNGVEMPALLDTGSPITVLNAQAAEVAGVESHVATKSSSFFGNLKNRFETAQAASRGQVLSIAGANGPVQLVQSTDPVQLSVVGDDGNDISLGVVSDSSPSSPKVFVGDLPGLAALNGLGVDSPPTVVLGMDMLRQRAKMVFRGQQNKVYFY